MDSFSMMVVAGGLYAMLARRMENESKDSISKNEIMEYLSQAAIDLSKEMNKAKDKD